MDIFGVLSLIGGLALFLYGMHVVPDWRRCQAEGWSASWRI